MSELATLKTEGDVSIITLDDGKANVFSYPMLETLQKILSEIPKDKGSVIITGRDGMFSGGFDLKTFASGDVDLIKNMSSLGFKTLFDLYTFPRPVVAAISGHAVALGIFVVCCCVFGCFFVTFFYFLFVFFFRSEVICVDFELTNCLSNTQK